MKNRAGFLIPGRGSTKTINIPEREEAVELILVDCSGRQDRTARSIS
jgi:hypothetical protein